MCDGARNRTRVGRARVICVFYSREVVVSCVYINQGSLTATNFVWDPVPKKCLEPVAPREANLT